jgi:hypothetical protein
VIGPGLGEPVGYCVGNGDGDGVKVGRLGVTDGDGVCTAVGVCDGVGAGERGPGDGRRVEGRVSGRYRVACWAAGVPEMMPATTAPAVATAANPSRSTRR